MSAATRMSSTNFCARQPSSAVHSALPPIPRKRHRTLRPLTVKPTGNANPRPFHPVPLSPPLVAIPRAPHPPPAPEHPAPGPTPAPAPAPFTLPGPAPTCSARYSLMVRRRPPGAPPPPPEPCTSPRLSSPARLPRVGGSSRCGIWGASDGEPRVPCLVWKWPCNVFARPEGWNAGPRVGQGPWVGEDRDARRGNRAPAYPASLR